MSNGIYVYSQDDNEFKKTVPYIVGARLPSAYQEVEYLENTAGIEAVSGSGSSSNLGSMINTGIHPIANSKVEIKFRFSTDTNAFRCLFGGYDNNTKNYGIVVTNSRLYIMYGTQTNTGLTHNFDKDVWYTLVFDTYNKQITITGNGYTDTYSFSSLSLPSQSSLSIYLFTNNAVGDSMTRFNTTYTLMGDIEYFKYYDNYADTEPSYSYVPCYRTSDSIAGMYDISWSDNYEGSSVDLGTLTWTNRESVSTGLFCCQVNDIKTGVQNVYVEGWNNGTYSGSLTDGQICQHDSAVLVYFKKLEWAGKTASEVKALMTGKTLYYQSTTDTGWSRPFYTGTGTFVVGEDVTIVQPKQCFVKALRNGDIDWSISSITQNGVVFSSSNNVMYINGMASTTFNKTCTLISDALAGTYTIAIKRDLGEADTISSTSANISLYSGSTLLSSFNYITNDYYYYKFTTTSTADIKMVITLNEGDYFQDTTIRPYIYGRAIESNQIVSLDSSLNILVDIL